MVTSPAGYKKKLRWLKKFILNGNKVLEAKKKIYSASNWNLGPFCHSKTLKK